MTEHDERILQTLISIADTLTMIDNRYHFKTLNKREEIAALALQGLLAKYGNTNPSDLISTAMTYADALIERLNIQVKEV